MQINKERYLEIIRFGVVGTTAMLIHYGIYYILLPFMDKNIAYSIGYFLSFLCNFLMSSYITFKVKPSLKRFFRFLCSHGINYFIYLGLFNFFIWIGVPTKYAPLPVYFIAVPISFLLVRYALVLSKKNNVANYNLNPDVSECEQDIISGKEVVVKDDYVHLE